MVVQYWGVRGSVAVPGPETVRYGGNTACVSVDLGELILILDMGTGAIPLGKYLLGSHKRIVAAFSHLHLDHIRGFPMFAPLYDEECAITLIGYDTGANDWFPTDMLDGVHFPANYLNIPCSIAKTPSSLLPGALGEHGRLSVLPVNHPGGALAFKVESGSQVLVHVPDNELVPGTASYRSLVEFARGADLLSHDAQYAESEYREKAGWGHSSWQRACGLALEASVNRLTLFHHDPDHDDEALDDIQRLSTQMFSPQTCVVAYEGLRIDLGVTGDTYP